MIPSRKLSFNLVALFNEQNDKIVKMPRIMIQLVRVAVSHSKKKLSYKKKLKGIRAEYSKTKVLRKKESVLPSKTKIKIVKGMLGMKKRARIFR